MAYSDFTLAKLQQQFGLVANQTTDLFGHVPEANLPPGLAGTLARYAPVAVNLRTEKAKSEFIIAPILMELKLQLAHQISLFSGIDFVVDPARGLTGQCDFLLARSPGQLDLIAPVCVIVEAKNEDIVAGIPQALAEMVAARQFNEQAGTPIDPICGVVTSGSQWRFLKFAGGVAYVDVMEYPIQMAGRIYAILTRMALGE